MLKSLWRLAEFRLRVAVLWLTLFSQLMLTFGFPLPAPRRSKSSRGIAYPCQSRPCGCLTSEECWKGDCCCFTIEQKLLWARANGITPPQKYQGLFERLPEADDTETGCPECAKLAAKKSCCGNVVKVKADLVSKESCCKSEKSVTLVLGIFVKKCRGTGPESPVSLDPEILSDCYVDLVDYSRPQAFELPGSETPSSHSACPPSPPPKSLVK
jgi:hypothetical protein